MVGVFQLIVVQIYLLKFSKNRPILSSSRDVRPRLTSVRVPFPCNFFRGLSLALRSHDQIPASRGKYGGFILSLGVRGCQRSLEIMRGR